jgi:hypothetical protein
MKTRLSSRCGLFVTDLVGWILGFGLTMPNKYFLDYAFRLIYPSIIDDMGSAIVRQLQSKLILLGTLVVVTAMILDVMRFFSANLAKSGDDDNNVSHSDSPFSPNPINDAIPKFITFALVVIQKTFILSIMAYLIQNSFATLNNTMDFLLSGPLPMILLANTLLIVICILIFCLLLFSIKWSYPWIRWVSKKVYVKSLNNRYYSKALPLISLLFHSLYIALLITAIVTLVTFTGNFSALVGLLVQISLLLALWVIVVLFLTQLLRKEAQNTEA